jgi:hypothetical protein
MFRYIYQFVHRVIQKLANEIIPSKRFPFNEYGFGGGAPTPSVPAPPPIAPAPVPTQTSPTSTLEGRQQQVAMLKYGALSTVSNTGGAAGITGAGSDFYPTMTPGTSAKQTIGG